MPSVTKMRRSFSINRRASSGVRKSGSVTSSISGVPQRVVVDERLGRGGNAALGTAHVHHLGGVLLHVDAQDADGHRVGTVLATLGHLQVGRVIAGQVAGALVAFAHGRRHGRGQALGVGRGARQALGLGLAKRAVGALGGTATGHVQVQVTVHGKGDRTLRGLEVLGHIGIEVVLAVEHRVALDLAVGGQGRLDDALRWRAC